MIYVSFIKKTKSFALDQVCTGTGLIPGGLPQIRPYDKFLNVEALSIFN